MIRKRITTLLIAMLTALGLVLASTPGAQAIVEPHHAGRVIHIRNEWTSPIGVWYSNPPGQGCACRLWYPVNTGDNTWTEAVGIQLGAGYECQMGYYGANFSGWWYAGPYSYDAYWDVGDFGLDVRVCWYVG